MFRYPNCSFPNNRNVKQWHSISTTTKISIHGGISSSFKKIDYFGQTKYTCKIFPTATSRNPPEKLIGSVRN